MSWSSCRAVRRQIGAEIGHSRNFESEKPSALVERQARLRVVVATLGSADEFLGALGDPLDGAAEPARGPQHQHPFRINKILHAKAAADIGRGRLDPLER